MTKPNLNTLIYKPKFLKKINETSPDETYVYRDRYID